MANRTDTSAKHIHGMNPQYILETILRNKIYNSMYWKEKCFALTSETIIDRVVELKYIGGSVGGNKSPTDFICLVLKLLQIQPDKDIVIEYLNNKDYKYLTALAAYYIRLTSKSKDVYQELEPLYVDYRKLRVRNPDGSFKIIHMDEYIEDLLTNEVVFEVTLPVLPKRRILEANEDLKPRVSILEADLSFDSEEENENKISRNEILEGDSEYKEISDDDYANINLDKFDKADEGSEISASEKSESEKNKKTKNKDRDYKHDDEKYLSKKRHYKEEDDHHHRHDRKDKEDKRKTEEPEVKVDENSVEYWMSLRKKLGIN